MITVQSMTEDEFSQFEPLVIEDLAQSNAKNIGLSIEDARESSTKQVQALLPQGISTTSNLFYTVISTETSETVGYLWCGIDEAKKRGFLFQIFVLEPYRGKGFGNKMLEFVDKDMREKGMTRIALNVFAHNTVAIELYNKQGYKTTNMSMNKWL